MGVLSVLVHNNVPIPVPPLRVRLGLIPNLKAQVVEDLLGVDAAHQGHGRLAALPLANFKSTAGQLLSQPQTTCLGTDAQVLVDENLKKKIILRYTDKEISGQFIAHLFNFKLFHEFVWVVVQICEEVVERIKLGVLLWQHEEEVAEPSQVGLWGWLVSY